MPSHLMYVGFCCCTILWNIVHLFTQSPGVSTPPCVVIGILVPYFQNRRQASEFLVSLAHIARVSFAVGLDFGTDLCMTAVREVSSACSSMSSVNWVKSLDVDDPRRPYIRGANPNQKATRMIRNLCTTMLLQNSQTEHSNERYRLWKLYDNNRLFSDCRYVPQLRGYSPTKLYDGAQMAIFWRFFCILHFQRAACSMFQTCILNSH